MNNGTYPYNVWQSFTADEKAYVTGLRSGTSSTNANNPRAVAQIESAPETQSSTTKPEPQTQQIVTYTGGNSMSRPGIRN